VQCPFVPETLNVGPGDSEDVHTSNFLSGSSSHLWVLHTAALTLRWDRFDFLPAVRRHHKVGDHPGRSSVRPWNATDLYVCEPMTLRGKDIS
jgi:hypothetical protein